ncbi:MAG: hypothetical protein A3J99_00995 [Sideroxydans sp. RIFOXYD2_FULL_59_7]|nr:MAG: hypothetical protein A3J99_00995 [Sideroxydans sp. RIFOXYD2_FULL_59_7]
MGFAFKKDHAILTRMVVVFRVGLDEAATEADITVVDDHRLAWGDCPLRFVEREVYAALA